MMSFHSEINVKTVSSDNCSRGRHWATAGNFSICEPPKCADWLSRWIGQSAPELPQVLELLKKNNGKGEPLGFWRVNSRVAPAIIINPIRWRNLIDMPRKAQKLRSAEYRTAFNRSYGMRHNERAFIFSVNKLWISKHWKKTYWLRLMDMDIDNRCACNAHCLDNNVLHWTTTVRSCSI